MMFVEMAAELVRIKRSFVDLGRENKGERDDSGRFATGET